MGGFPIQVSESILHQLVQWCRGAMLGHTVGLAVQGKVDVYSAVGGAQITWPNMPRTRESAAGLQKMKSRLVASCDHLVMHVGTEAGCPHIVAEAPRSDQPCL